MPVDGQSFLSSKTLYAFREVNGVYERIGSIQTDDHHVSFTYDAGYLSNEKAQSISLSLPLRKEPFCGAQSLAFFEGLLPEGPLRKEFAYAAHVDERNPTNLLSRLNNESIGGIVFDVKPEKSSAGRAYVPISFDDLAEFSRKPMQTAVEMGTASRLSLAGAQIKVGLYHVGANYAIGWYRSEGSAPSNTIVKAGRDTFPRQTINEAFCLSVARHCGFDVASARLIPVSGEPLIALERFDRATVEGGPLIDGLPLPIRLHQEDFCQAAGLSSHYKYEPTDGRYLELGARVISRTVSNPFGDKMMFFDRVLLDYLIGNCDNHLKNSSIVWNETWSACELAPLYDITCTTMYPALDREMGIALCESRKIDDVSAKDIREAARRIGISDSLGWKHYLDLRDEFLAALPAAEQELVDQGFHDAHDVAAFITRDSAPRCAL